MTSSGFSLFRFGRRLFRFSLAILRAAVSAPRTSVSGSPAEAGRWIQAHATSIRDALEIRCRHRGAAAAGGLILCNHISYLDILVLASASPVVFVAKSEVRGWSILGWLASKGGTLFVRRNKRSDVARVGQELARTIAGGVPVLLFPEGTSSDGQAVLPFHSSLLEPAVAGGWPVTPAALAYRLEGGSVAEHVSYWGEMTFLPHFLRLLGLPAVEALVEFGAPMHPGKDRKLLARTLHEKVSHLHAQLQETPAAWSTTPSVGSLGVGELTRLDLRDLTTSQLSEGLFENSLETPRVGTRPTPIGRIDD